MSEKKQVSFTPNKKWVFSLRGKVEKIREKCACGHIPQACRCNTDNPPDSLGDSGMEHH